VMKKYCGVVRLICFPLPFFFNCVFGRFSIRGTQKRDKKNHVIRRHRTCTKVQSWPNKVCTYIVIIIFSVAPCSGYLPDTRRFQLSIIFLKRPLGAGSPEAGS
jgi:hypothetical protein